MVALDVTTELPQQAGTTISGPASTTLELRFLGSKATSNEEGGVDSKYDPLSVKD